MTPLQLRSALDRLGLSQVQAGRLLGLDHHGRTVRRWASGDSEVPESAAILLRLMLAGHITKEQIKSVS